MISWGRIGTLTGAASTPPCWSTFWGSAGVCRIVIVSGNVAGLVPRALRPQVATRGRGEGCGPWVGNWTASNHSACAVPRPIASS